MELNFFLEQQNMKPCKPFVCGFHQLEEKKNLELKSTLTIGIIK